MPPQVAGLSPLPVLDRGSAKPIYRQIYESYREAILEARILPGEQLPSTRSLAAELAVSRIPVVLAFELLHAEGYCAGRVGAGTFVAEGIPARPPRPQREARRGERRTVARSAAGLVRDPTPWLSGSGAFRVGDAAFEHFPLATWKRLAAQQSRRLTAAELRYGDPLGHLPLRQAIASYLGAMRGVRCDSGQVLVTSGSQQALAIAARALLDPGDAAWIEEPGYWGVREVLRSARVRAVPIPVDAEGFDVVHATRRGGRARVAFVTPSHQFPLGSTLSATRRLQLLDWARGRAGWIVEDDYDSEYRHDGQPVATLHGLDASDRVIYVGTFSKVLFGALRLGFIVLPEDLVPVFAAVRRTFDISPATFPQAILASFIQEGHFARHLRRMRSLYRERRDELREALRTELATPPPAHGGGAGMHLVLELPAGSPERELAARAAREGLWTMPLSFCRMRPGGPPGLVLGYGGVETAEIRRHVQRLAALLAAR